MSAPEVVRIADKLAAIQEHWKPRIAGMYNGNELRVSKVQGEFPWHKHDNTDELFLVIKGELVVEFRDQARTLQAGDFIVVPKGTEHRTRADAECHMLFIDRAGEPNTGDQPAGAMTLTTLERL